MQLRPYQLEAVRQIRTHAALAGQGAILQLATGAGKTAIFCDVLKGAYLKGRCALMVVRGKQLVHQASERLTREEVIHGICQGSASKDTHERILVCSVDTLYRRKQSPKADLLVIDECHLSHSDGYRWLLKQYPGVFKLGVSATPHHDKGMRHIGDKIIRTASFAELVTGGFLVGGKYFIPYTPDLRGIKIRNGDFATKELDERSRNDEELTANAARVWSTHLQGKSTLCYAVSLKHADILAVSLKEAGARVAIIVANTKDGERRNYIRELEDGKLDVIVSVGVLTTGVDIPPLRAILCCRPTKSYNLWIQILGRGTRPSPGKENFLVFDLSGNLRLHGPIEAELIASLDSIPPNPKITIVTCDVCFAAFEKGTDVCPACGASLAKTKPREESSSTAGLTENEEIKEIVIQPWELELPGLIKTAKDRQLRKGWIYHRIREKHGEEMADIAWPRIRSLKKWPVKTKAPEPDATPALFLKS